MDVMDRIDGANRDYSLYGWFSAFVAQWCAMKKTCLILAGIIYVALYPSLATASQVIKIDRGVHSDFEIFVFHCDSAGEFRLEYDRVAREVTVELEDGKIARSAAVEIARLQPGSAFSAGRVEPNYGRIALKVQGAVFVREYYIGEPAALILDLSRAADAAAALPFELDRGDYLRRGGQAERSGRLELALAYVNRVQAADPSDIALTHRSGVIEQRLGRWDQALETFARTALMAEFADDAYARRTLIYFAKGDADAAVNEWSAHFHRIKPAVMPQTAPEIVQTSTPPANPNASGEIAEPQMARFVLPKLLDLNEKGYRYLGLGLLIVGLTALIATLLSGRQGAEEYLFAYPAPEVEYNAKFTSRTAKTEPASTLNTYFDRILRPVNIEKTPVPPVQTENHQPVAAAYSQSYAYSAYRKINGLGAPAKLAEPVKIKTHTSPRVQLDRILALRAENYSESEIAGRLGLSRDVVAMALSLAQTAEVKPS